MTIAKHRIAAIIAAVPIFLLFPVGTMLLSLALRYPVGDPPFIAIIPGFAFGVAFGLALATLTWFCAKHGAMRVSVMILVGVGLFDLAAIPLTRWITRSTRERTSQVSVSNNPAAPNAGIAPQLTIVHHRPGVGEPGR